MNADGTWVYGQPGSDAARLRAEAHREVVRVRDPAVGVARTTVKFVHYRLVARGITAKDDARRAGRKPSQNVSEALTWLREHEHVGWSEIIDSRRHVIDHRGWASVAEGLTEAVEGLRLDAWEGNPPALVVESHSLAEFFAPVAYTYRLGLVPLGGQSSGGFLANDAVHVLGPKTLVLYVGDWDKAGGDIERSAIDRLARFAPHWAGEWQRLAVTDEQFERYRPLAITKPDHRFRPARLFETLEAEAIEQNELTATVTAALDAVLPVSLADLDRAEANQRATARRRLRRWRS